MSDRALFQRDTGDGVVIRLRRICDGLAGIQLCKSEVLRWRSDFGACSLAVL